MCDCVFPSLYACMVACYNVTDSLVRSELSNRRIRIRVRCGPDTLAIRRSNTRDDLKIQTSSCNANPIAIRPITASFHVSICFCTISSECFLLYYCYLLLSVNILFIFIKLHFTFNYLPVQLCSHMSITVCDTMILLY